MASSTDSPLVLVTGASGFIAMHVVKILQGEGYKVRGTVRNPDDKEKVRPLKELVPDATYPIELVQADLTKDEGWNEAVKDCTYVMHMASPFPNAPPSHEDDIIKPAVDGTKRVLEACAQAGTVKRVVLTSSIVSVHGEPTYEEGKIYNEEDWTNLDALGNDFYSKSKTVAEKFAWDYVKELPDDKKFELSVINPGLVLGPVLSSSCGTSVEIVKRLLERSIPMVAKVNFCVCDVRDVAQAHFKAMTLPEAAGKRHLITTQTVWMKDIALVLSKEFKSQGYRVPTMAAPYFAVWLNSIIDKNSRLVLNRIGKEFKFDNQRMKDVLGITPHELNQSITDTGYSLMDHGLVKVVKKVKTCKKDGEQTTEEKPANGEVEGSKEAEAEPKEKEEVEEKKMEELEPEDKDKAAAVIKEQADQKQEIEAN